MAHETNGSLRFLFPRNVVLAGASVGAVMGIAALVITAVVWAALEDKEVGPLVILYGLMFGMPWGGVVGATAAFVAKLVLADRAREARVDASTEPRP
jgi:hypothetical protein